MVRSADVHLVGWSLAGIFCLLAVAAAVDGRAPLPVRTVTAIGSPVDVSAVPLVAPLLRNNDLADGRLVLSGRAIPLAGVNVPVLVVAGRDDVIAPQRAVRAVVDLVTGAPQVRFETAPGGYLGVVTGRRARHTTWTRLDDHSDGAAAGSRTEPGTT
ncbi:hypothetical protein [Pseudonocardia sp.]|uniref:hypothetical protein n=1 Tax=Pseudonocardia sp. TaxID=60912 RepID=UPI003D0F78B6